MILRHKGAKIWLKIAQHNKRLGKISLANKSILKAQETLSSSILRKQIKEDSEETQENKNGKIFRIIKESLLFIPKNKLLEAYSFDFIDDYEIELYLLIYTESADIALYHGEE